MGKCKLQKKNVTQTWTVYLQSFTDIQVMAASHPLLKLNYRQLGRGHFLGEFFGFRLPHGMFWRSRLNLSAEGEGTIPLGYLLVGLSAGTQDYWHEQVVSPDSLVIGKDPGGLKHRTGDSHEAWVWLLSQQRYSEMAKTLGHDASTLKKTPVLQAIDNPAHKSLKAHISEFLAVAQGCQPLNTEQVTWFENELIRKTLRCLVSPGKDSELSAFDAAKSARELMHNRCQQPLCITTLCQELNISERTLRDHFIRHYETSPAAYHLTLRLNRARIKLLASKPTKGVVSAAATESGFWHMGRFAKHYLRHFGESPMTTAQREVKFDSPRGWEDMPLT